MRRAPAAASQPGDPHNHLPTFPPFLYLMSKLTDAQLRTSYEILKLAAPDHVLGDFD